MYPFLVTDTVGQFDVACEIKGGGPSGKSFSMAGLRSEVFTIAGLSCFFWDCGAKLLVLWFFSGLFVLH